MREADLVTPAIRHRDGAVAIDVRERCAYATGHGSDVRHRRPVVILNTCRTLEATEAHIDGAVHIPLRDLPARLSEVSDGEVQVHCRPVATTAFLLAAAGRQFVAVDGVVVGCVTGLSAPGGGFLVVPALALLGGLPMPVAVGTYCWSSP